MSSFRLFQIKGTKNISISALSADYNSHFLSLNLIQVKSKSLKLFLDKICKVWNTNLCFNTTPQCSKLTLSFKFGVRSLLQKMLEQESFIVHHLVKKILHCTENTKLLIPLTLPFQLMIMEFLFNLLKIF